MSCNEDGIYAPIHFPSANAYWHIFDSVPRPLYVGDKIAVLRVTGLLLSLSFSMQQHDASTILQLAYLRAEDEKTVNDIITDSGPALVHPPHFVASFTSARRAVSSFYSPDDFVITRVRIAVSTSHLRLPAFNHRRYPSYASASTRSWGRVCG